MRRILLATFLNLALCLQTKAQVFIINDNITNGRMSEISASVVDSLSNEPIAFASFYVIPAKDTTISNFTLTDTEGKAKLEEVPFGDYVLHVEMLGYKPFTKQRFFRDRMVDLGVIKLQVDEKYLEAAVVTDVGNPIVVKKDTVEFNASSFQVGTNSMLKDLLKRMPGMEITDDGKVKFNGEAIDKLTVGGRTFFFDDQSTALNNLPASIVDKIRVIDRESESTRATGIQDGSREKVLDVGLKKEYEKGWFGNAGLKGGTTLTDGQENPLRDDRGILYSGNVLASAYSEKDQLTLIGNGMNLNDSNGVVFVMVSSDGTRRTNLGQIASAAQLGVNANTSRIKGVETTVGANYKYGDSRTGTTSARTTFQEDGNLYSNSEDSGRQFSNNIASNMEFKKEEGKVLFTFRPSFSYSKTDSRNSSSTETSREGSFLNRSESSGSSLNTDRYVYGSGSITIRQIGAKEGRMINIGFNANLGGSEGESHEFSSMRMASGNEERSLNYVSNGDTRSLGGSLKYAEPLGERWLLSFNSNLNYSMDNSLRDAFDASGKNEYYSSESRNHSIEQYYGLTAQYSFNEGKSWFSFGPKLDGTLNETYSKSFNVAQTTGEDEWFWTVSPILRMQHVIGDNRLSFYVTGYSQQPSRSSMIPTMNIINPSRPTMGNIYLKPYSYSYTSFNWNRNDREKFTTMMFSTYGNIKSNPITYARWYDSDGILYSIPVNSRKKSLNWTMYGNYTTPLDSKKHWFVTLGVSSDLLRSTSYQTKGSHDGIDRETFDYGSFMESFWGDSEGNLFYSGKSGFAESNTTTFSPSMSATIRYSGGGFSGSISASTNKEIARYSLDPKLDLNTMDNSIGARANYTTKHEFEFDTDISYKWYIGYPTGYGAPEWQWNGEISKNVKAFTLSLKIHDILDQTRTLTHTVTANYEEDTYQLVMGRYILFGLKWNFGKMNAAHSQKAQRAAMNMVF